MDWLIRILTFAKGIFSLGICLFLCILLISLKPKEKHTFHEVAISTFLYPAQAILSRLDHTLFIFDENKHLKQTNTVLRLENDYLRQALRRIPRLMAMDSFENTANLKLKMAQISAEEANRFVSTYVINIGLADSVNINMPVLTSAGIVGKVVKSYVHHSLVQLISDPNFKVSVICDRSRIKGFVESGASGKAIGRFPIDAEILSGDTLITSGMGGVFPKGLLVGIVTADSLPIQQMEDIVHSVNVRLFQNPNRVEDVFVLIKEDSWMIRKDP